MSPEQIRRHIPEINAKFLLHENGLVRAQKSLQKWYQAKDEHHLTAVWFCDDARLLASTALRTNSIVPIRTIAAAGDPSPFKNILTHEAVQQGVVMGHFDSMQSREYPTGCGGEMAKEKRVGHPHPESNRKKVLGYIDHHIETPDVVRQTLKSALNMSRLAGNKPVLAVLWDHATYSIVPIGIFSEGGNKFEGMLGLDEIRSSNDRRISVHDLVALGSDKIPPSLRTLIAKNDEFMQKRGFQDIAKINAVQNPSTVMITTSIVPMGVRYPSLADKPNSVFKIALPYAKADDFAESGEFVLERNDVDTVIAQTEYPIGHCVEAKNGQPFRDTKTIVIETPSIEASRAIYAEMRKQKWFKKWKNEKKGAVTLVEVHHGKVTSAEDVL